MGGYVRRHRHHYSARTRQLCVNMPKLMHETFVRAFDAVVTQKLKAYEGGKVDAQNFVPCGCSDVDIVAHQAKAWAAQYRVPVPSCYRPDATWFLLHRGHRRQRRPGLVVKVCSKQPKNDALEKLPFYFACTDAEVRCVIISDLREERARSEMQGRRALLAEEHACT